MTTQHLWHQFLTTAATQPNELALIANNRRLTYAELQQEIFCYVDFLHKKGVKSGDRIAIALPRQSELIVALLAVLASGACYIPLDRRYPRDRNLNIIKDSTANFIICDDDSLDCYALAPPTGERIATQPQISALNLNDLAYIIYTSGSTGNPKGVMINHANVSALIEWANSTYQRTEFNYTLAATSICFDLSIFEIFVPLCLGGCVVLVDNALSLIDAKDVPPLSLINTVPSAIEALLKANAIPRSVQIINLAGEALQQALVNELYENTKVQRIYNLYGPTETTTYSSYYLAEKTTERTMVPIGQAILGTQIYLLDSNQQLVPKLVRGEIYIAGKGVSNGYCQREQENAERFVIIKIKGQALKAYRTGDIARINHEGLLEYLGRKDQQIKIRGFRIEPDEIAHAIKQISGVEQAYVMTHPEIEQGQKLIAYLVSNDKDMNAEILRHELQKTLPEYMLPYHYLFLPVLPLNHNGKIDRAALPLPGKEEDQQIEYQNHVETKLATLWENVLNRKSFNRHDNFFYVGGHSLSAVKLQSIIQQTFNIIFKLEEVFNHPSIKEQAELIHARQLSKHQIPQSFEIIARPNELPLSFSQQRLWYLQYAEESTPISNIPISIEISGELDLSALQNTIQMIISRHEILRTTYHSTNYQLVQIIHDNFSFTIPIVECVDADLMSLLDEEANKKFDLTKDLMIRAVYFKSTEINILLITQHHIASDAWSLNILMHELSAYYPAYHRNQPLPVLSTPTQYADYSVWQRYYLNDRILKGDLNYWKKKLADAPNSIKLPYDKQRPEMNRYHGEFYQWDLEQQQVDKLKQLANKNQATLFMVLLTGFHVLLYRYSQQNDFCVGILSANRPFNELENTLGFFVNTLVTRPQLDSNFSIRQLLQQTKKQVLDDLAHQQLPFDKVVESLQPNREANRHPFFQVLFSLQNALENDLELDGISTIAREFDRKISKFDLTLSLVEKKNSLSAIFEFNSDLFLQDTVARLTQHYVQILKQMINNLDISLGEIDLLTNTEKTNWLTNLNDVHHPYPADASISDLFAECVRLYPNQIALVGDSCRYTYTELDELSNQLAHLLQTYGVIGETPVGLLLPRCTDAIVSMLAVVKTGGCYVPIDPAWPSERISYMLEDAEISVVISIEKLADSIPCLTNLYTIFLDTARDEIAQQPKTQLTEIIKPDQSCYIIYTSGSTGKPKGVIATHQGVIRLVKNTNYVELNAQETLLQISQLVFDGATFDIWGSLLNGGKLVLIPDGIPELAKLADLLKQEKVTTIFVTTHLFNSLVDYKLNELCHLQQILFGGDVASTYHVAKFKARYPQCKISNIYGPTECTTYALSYLIPDSFDETKPLPLGTPISNTSVVILSEDLQVQPVGVPGQICLGGPGLAKGYLNRADLTREKFINNPINELPTERLYLTGDLGCYRADGQINFLGRVDNQVKLRGYRIELPEIEQALREIENIIDSIVVIQKPEDLLIAYLLVKDEQTITLQCVKQMLTSRLPRYMLPDAIEILKQFPLTTNGKIDKNALPRHQVHRQIQNQITSKEDGITDLIQQTWIEVLNDKAITCEDNFFEIGGNSLKIVHVLDCLQNHFKDNAAILAKLDITALFQYPTINELAHYLKTNLPESELTQYTRKHSNRDKRKNAALG